MFLGIDFGTSGVRVCIIDAQEHIAYLEHSFITEQTPENWRDTLHALLKKIPRQLSEQLQRISIDATSATVLICDVDLNPVSPALLYNDNRALKLVPLIQKIAPAGHTVCSSTSGLAKFLWLTQEMDMSRARYFMHQADWISALFTGVGGISDYHNALKTGYNVEIEEWPEWITTLPYANILPEVLPPGSFIKKIDPVFAKIFNINPACHINVGTTDSIAAFIAASVHQPGEAVTSLGSTLVLKLLSKTRVENAEFGVYSHRYGDYWLAGGASNAGGETLRQHFSNEQLKTLSARINTNTLSPLDYYPLPRQGERFPVNDPKLEPRLTPRPEDDVAFLHGILQGLSQIEASGYAKLVELGATPLTSVTTSGGGSYNPQWQTIRSKLFKIPVKQAKHTEAAYGTAILAKQAGII